jgi:hypothetical protein
LVKALRDGGDPFVAVEVGSYRPVGIQLKVRINFDPALRAETVLAAVSEKLNTAFGFTARQFAEPVYLSEVFSVASAVTGVRHVAVDSLYRTVPPANTPQPHARLIAAPAERLADGSIRGAELLTLAAEASEDLEVMS